MLFNIILVGIILFALVFGETAMTLLFYGIYRYDGGKKSLRWYKNLMANCTIDF